jgi:hypothetical protein
MTSDRVREVIETYRRRFDEIGVEKIDYPHGDVVDTSNNVLGHCYGMLDKMLEFINEGRTEKTFRWLGFIQGCLWASRIYTLEDLKNHNRPT